MIKSTGCNTQLYLYRLCILEIVLTILVKGNGRTKIFRIFNLLNNIRPSVIDKVQKKSHIFYRNLSTNLDQLN